MLVDQNNISMNRMLAVFSCLSFLGTCVSVCLQSVIWEMAHLIFRILWMKLESHKVKKKWRLIFQRRNWWVSGWWGGGGGGGAGKNDLTFRFSGFWQKSNQSICTLLYWIWKNLQSFNLLWKPNIWESWPENFRPIRMQDSLNVNIPQTSRGMNYNFCTWSSIYRSNEYIQSFKVGVVRNAKACAKQCKMVGQLNLKN